MTRDEAQDIYTTAVALVRSYATEVVRREATDHLGWDLVGPARIDEVLDAWAVPEAVRSASYAIVAPGAVRALLDALREGVWTALGAELDAAEEREGQEQ